MAFNRLLNNSLYHTVNSAAYTRVTSILSSSILSANHIIKRHEAIDAKTIETRSPYEELKVDPDVNSTEQNPMKVNAYGDERTIACVCDDMHFMTLKKGPPVKCKCGYWFHLVDARKFWEHPPTRTTSI